MYIKNLVIKCSCVLAISFYGVTCLSSVVRAQLTQSADEQPPADYVLTPVGFTHKSCVAESSDDSVVEITDDEGVRIRDGKSKAVIKELPRCAHAPKWKEDRFGPKQNRGGHKGEPVPNIDGWMAAGNISLSGPETMYDDVHADWKVPAAPSQNGATVFLFNSLMDYYNSGIIQPVLQWGTSAAGGGNYWAVSNWMVLNNGVTVYNSLSKVAVGDQLSGRIYSSDCDEYYQCNWTITMKVNGGIRRTLQPSARIYPWTEYQTGVLEVYSLSSCRQLPAVASVEFNRQYAREYLRFDVVQFTSTVWDSWVWTTSPSCRQSVSNDKGGKRTTISYTR